MVDQTPEHLPIRSVERWFLVVLVVSALIIRWVYLSEMQKSPFFDHPRLDALFHDTWAKTIASGEILGNKVFFRAPVYPYFLAGLYTTFGHSYLAPRIVQHALGVLALLILYFFARRVFGIRTAVFATTLASLYAVLIYFEGELLFDSMLAFACLVWLLIVEKWKDARSQIHWLVLGVIYGVVCCIRPPFLAIAPIIFCLLLWWRFRSLRENVIGKGFMLLILGCLLPILPITIRNYVVGKDIVLIASQGGVNFYIGNNPVADGYTSMMPGLRGASWENRDATYLVEKVIGHPPSPSEESWFWYKQGMDFALHYPLQYSALLAKKLYLFWNWYEIPNNQSFYSFRNYSTLLQYLSVGFWLVGPLGALGMFIALKERRARFHVAFALIYCCVIILFFVCDRFRLPIVPLLCMFAGYALHRSIEQIQYRQWKWLAVNAALGCCIALFVNSNLYTIEKDTTAKDTMSLGIIELDKGNPIKAISYFAEVAKVAPIPRPNLYLDWGVAELRIGNTGKAIEKFHQELHFYPDANNALSNLALVYFSLRQYDSTVYYGTRAIEGKPYLPDAYIMVARSYQRQGKLEKAAILLEGGSSSCAENFVGGKLLLAGIYKALGRIDETKKMYQDILANHGRFRQPLYEPERDYGAHEQMEEREEEPGAMASFGLGHVYGAELQLDSAIVYFRNAVNLSPGYADAWADLGVAYMQTLKYANADSALQTAISLQPHNHVYWYNYGTLLGRDGHLDEAREAFNRTLDIQPDFNPARKQLDVIEKLLHREHIPR